MTSALATAWTAVLVLLVQTTVLPYLRPLVGVTPNLVLVLAVYVGLRYPGALGALGVFVLGYFLDTFAGATLGFQTLGLLLVFAVASLASSTVRTDSGGPLMVVVFGAGCLDALAEAALYRLGIGGSPPSLAVLRYGLGQAAGAALLAPLVLRLVGWSERMLGVE
ncbi:MAG TPA: rod shape-determining protein MreD [Candidatus Limnocylindria bacterium]|nr:rod shape-determining protein MreD [Candidatus Limnocylindria bacterium]